MEGTKEKETSMIGIPGKKADDESKNNSHAEGHEAGGEDEHSKKIEFIESVGLSSQEAEELLQKYGRNELEDKKKPKVCCSPHTLSFLTKLTVVDFS
jgi:hypothetical protein